MDVLEPTKLAVQAAFDKWIKRLGLAWWDIDIVYYDDPASIISIFKPQYGEGLVNAQVSVNWMYAEACIEINLPAMQGKEQGKLERIVVHELLHILVAEMNENEIHHEERVVTSLTKTIFWVDSFAREDVAAVENSFAPAALPLTDEVTYL